MLFARTHDKGKPIPLNADPETGRPAEYPDNGRAGRIQLEMIETNLLEGIEEFVVRVLTDGQEADPDAPIWLSHFVTCPAAHRWRKENNLPELVR